MDKAFLKVVFSELMRIVTLPARLKPVKKNRILFTGLTGGNVYDYSCNPKYIYEYMRDHYPGRFDYVWAVSDLDKYAFLKEEGVKLVKHFTVSSFPILLTAKVVVTNGSYAPWFPFRKNQYVINTWHGGGAYKKVENERPDANFATRKRADFTASNIDLFLASCRVQEEQMIRTTYHYKGEVLRAGTPRNDKLVTGKTGEMAQKVRERYNIPEDGKIILYAPTYRTARVPVIMDGDYVLEQLNGRIGIEPAGSEKGSVHAGEWYFLSRYHRYQNNDMNVRVKGDKVINAADYPDMQELLSAADVLVTDYSSCVWDYAFLKKPCVLFVPDKLEYISKNGFYVDMDEWPFDQTTTMEKLCDSIVRLVNDNGHGDSYWKRLGEHIDKLGSYETGHAAKAVAEKILEKTR